MMEVYLVVEEFNDYGMFGVVGGVAYEEIIGIASSKDIAQERINERIEHIKKSLEKLPDSTYFIKENDNGSICLTTMSKYDYVGNGDRAWKIVKHNVNDFHYFDSIIFP